MSDGKKNALLLGSVAANIFLVAFVLGRWSSPGLMPQPEMMFHGSGHGMMMSQMPPPPDGMRGPPMGGPHGPGGPGGHGMGMNGPPMFGPGDVLNTQEMQQAQQEMQQNFQKVETMRADFAKKLAEGSVTKEDVLKHFNEVDAVMDSVKLKVQEKTAEKIAGMSEQDRKAFAERLAQRGGPPPGGMPPGMGGPGMQGGPGGGMPGMPGGPSPDQPPGQGPDGPQP